jgi:hypothetical protein
MIDEYQYGIDSSRLKVVPYRISLSIAITHAPDFFHLGSLDVQIPVAAISVM